MGLPRINSARTSALWVDENAGHDIIRLLVLVVLLHLYLPDGADYLRAYRRYRSRASQFFDDCVDGGMKPVKNQFQFRLNLLLAGRSVAHLYIDGQPGTKTTYFVSLVRGADNLWWLRHRKIRLAPTALARDGVFASWRNPPPHPDVVCIQEPLLDRVITGGVSCAAFAEEANQVYEVARQLTQVCAVCQLLGCLHRNEIVTWHEPGRVVLRADMAGNPWTQPYGFAQIAVSPYARHGSIKARINVLACASDVGLYTEQTPRSIQPAIRGVSEYEGNPNEPTEKTLLAELLLSRLLPVVGVVDAAGMVNLFALHYDQSQQKGVVGQLSAGRSLHASTGLPLIRCTDQRSRQVWIPNRPLLSILRELLDDPTPSEQAKLDRWYAITRVFGFLGVVNSSRLPGYFDQWGVPLPEDAERNISDKEAAIGGT